MQKHIGTMTSTGSRVFVVFRQIPNDPNHCLVTYRDSIPEIYAYAVGKFVNEEGQNYVDLSEAMHLRGIMPTGENMLSALHNGGLLVRKPTSEVQMWLDERNSIMLDVLNDNLDAVTTQKPSHEVSDFNPFDTTESTVLEDIISQIKSHEREIESLISRAKMLDETFEYGEPVEQPIVLDEDSSDDLVIRIPAEDIVTMSQTKFNEIAKGHFKEHKKRLNG